MAKEQIKAEVIEVKGHVCQITGMPLPEDFSLFDTHRQQHKKDGGIYTLVNTGVAMPTAHMVEHGTYRERDPELDTIKTMIDDRRQITKLKVKCHNQLLAYKRGTDSPNPQTVEFLEGLEAQAKKEESKHDRKIEKFVKQMNTPLAQAALGVRSVGSITVAHCLAYIQIEKARHASSLWSYVGLDKPSHERYEKGVAGGGNKTLRTILYTMADSQVKGRGPYREVYDRVKARLEVSEKMVSTRNTQGKMITVAWKDTKPCHRHGAALRAVMKHFLADYWYAGRTLAGLETNPIYAEAMLGMSHKTIRPEERGWKY